VFKNVDLRDNHSMIPKELRKKLMQKIHAVDEPREMAVDVMYDLQKYYGYLSDEAVYEASDLLGMSPLEIEELATFYDFIYREPTGKYVIHVCDSIACWMEGHLSIMDYLCAKLHIELGGTTRDGLFTLLPVGCVGFCDRAPVMMINGKMYGNLTPERIDAVLLQLIEQKPLPIEAR
jgi:NADH-quinone oxidoreductase subunit E